MRPRFWMGRREMGLEMVMGLLCNCTQSSRGPALRVALRLGWTQALPAAQPGGKADM